MTSCINNEADLRNWLVDYLVTNIGCTPDEVDPDLSLADLSCGSRDAVVLSGQLSELLGKTVSPIDFWEHPTINALAAFLTAPQPEPESDAALKRPARSSFDEPTAVIGIGCRIPGGISGLEALSPRRPGTAVHERAGSCRRPPARRTPHPSNCLPHSVRGVRSSALHPARSAYSRCSR